MRHPFQCIATVKPASSIENGTYLLAACGPKLISTCLATGKVTSEWSTNGVNSSVTTTHSDDNEDGERPAKKQKTGPRVTFSPNIIKITISPDQRHAVVATDDKYIRVFEIQHDALLLELSQRCMPKRPCAIRVLPDNSTILSGDKFGDVYSLPLIPEQSDSEAKSASADTADLSESSQLLQPTASNLTVHTQRNRKTLEAQMKQKKAPPKPNEPLKFVRELLLGHVSMLTDVLYATRDVAGKQRAYILTADRDEHIRISRGPPQSHVIEGFCLGHREFVSKMCLVPGTEFLVSGGGDDWIGVWEWPAFKLRHKLRRPDSILQAAGRNSIARSSEDDYTAVSGIWIAPLVVNGQPEIGILVTWEHVPILACLPISQLQKDDLSQSNFALKTFDHPILDVTCSDGIVFLSFDAREDSQPRIRAYRFKYEGDDAAGYFGVTAVSDIESRLSNVLATSSDISSARIIDDLVYGIANLRKRTGWPDEAVADANGTVADTNAAVADADETIADLNDADSNTLEATPQPTS